MPDVNAEIAKQQAEEIANLKVIVAEQKEYIRRLYQDDAAAKNALGEAQFMAWQAWQSQQQQSQQQVFHVEDGNGNATQVIVTPDH